jgi:hypothetical protein
MEAFFIGLFTVIVGLLFVFAGYQFYRVLLPIWGFLIGFMWGAQAVAYGMGTSFLATALGWTLGFGIGIVLAVLAYFFYELAVAVLAGSIGYWIVGSFLLGIGIQPGFFVTTMAILAGVVFAVVALVLNAPKGLLVLLSAFGGASVTIGGLLILFGQAPVEILGTALLSGIIGSSFWWSLMWIVLTIAGIVTQLQTSTIYDQTMSYPYTTDMSAMGVKGGKSKSKKQHEEDRTRQDSEDMDDEYL